MGVARKSYISIPHKLKLTSGNKGLSIVTDNYHEAPFGVDSDNIIRERTRTNQSRLGTTISGQKPTKMSPYTLDMYNRSGAVYYAHSWTYSGTNLVNNTTFDSYYNNANYKDFNSVGGDCSNLVSQAMYNGGGAALVGTTTVAGGTTSTTNWFYLNHGSSNQALHSWTSSWTYVPDNYTFQQGSYGYGYGTETPANSSLGDLEFVKWSSSNSVYDHVSMVTGFDSSGNPYLS